ncbi:MAG: hypothetical protein KKA81_15990, partial [Bacteroidetes bacterium]|nr:hypothetical protein [Bacteroidota bacterium]
CRRRSSGNDKPSKTPLMNCLLDREAYQGMQAPFLDEKTKERGDQIVPKMIARYSVLWRDFDLQRQRRGYYTPVRPVIYCTELSK